MSENLELQSVVYTITLPLNKSMNCQQYYPSILIYYDQLLAIDKAAKKILPELAIPYINIREPF
jgi:hypothetical protein